MYSKLIGKFESLLDPQIPEEKMRYPTLKKLVFKPRLIIEAQAISDFLIEIANDSGGKRKMGYQW